MAYSGLILHHSACPNINGKGYDYLILKGGGVIPGSEPVEPDRLHICLEGDFHQTPPNHDAPGSAEQFFVLHKLLQRLYPALAGRPEIVQAHSMECPGRHFPWEQLVISGQDGYH